jgi:predicted RND superfamily exporter protein
VVGFAPYATSDFFSVRIMGTLLPATLVAALLTDLLLVPALIKLGAFRFRMKAGERGDQ